MQDMLPEDMATFRFIEKVFRDCCIKWGYQEVRTPTIEYLHLFTSAGTLTPNRLGKVYSFLDWDGWSGERVVLRPDGTIPVARLYTEAMKDKELARLFYASNIFIFEESGEKTREKWQCGAELIGVSSPLADAELISMYFDVLQQLGIKDVEMRLSHAGLVRAILAKMGVDPEDRHRMFDRILDGDAEALSRLSSEHPELESGLFPLLNMKGKSQGYLENLKAVFSQSIPEAIPHLDDLLKTVAFLESLGYRYHIDVASGAGFEYYTGMIYQLYAGEEKIGGGGRYDALIPAMGGGEVPASGFALYMNSIMKLVKSDTPAADGLKKIAVRLTTAGNEVIKAAFDVCSRLRAAGYVAELDLTGSKQQAANWILQVRETSLAFKLIDVASKQEYEKAKVEEVLRLIKEQSGS
jgi:histidyl-tRNA synthetase